MIEPRLFNFTAIPILYVLDASGESNRRLVGVPSSGELRLLPRKWWETASGMRRARVSDTTETVAVLSRRPLGGTGALDTTSPAYDVYRKCAVFDTIIVTPDVAEYLLAGLPMDPCPRLLVLSDDAASRARNEHGTEYIVWFDCYY